MKEIEEFHKQLKLDHSELIHNCVSHIDDVKLCMFYNSNIHNKKKMNNINLNSTAAAAAADDDDDDKVTVPSTYLWNLDVENNPFYTQEFYRAKIIKHQIQFFAESTFTRLFSLDQAANLLRSAQTGTNMNEEELQREE